MAVCNQLGYYGIRGNLVLFVGQDELGEHYLTYSCIWYSLGKKYALHIWDIQAPPNKSCMRRFRNSSKFMKCL